jgi:hypothetical protein
MPRHNTNLIEPPSSRLRPVPADLLLDNPGLMPQHQRLLVASFAFDVTDRDPIGAMKRARSLYQEHDPFGYYADHCAASNGARPLSIPGILAELDALAAR